MLLHHSQAADGRDLQRLGGSFSPTEFPSSGIQDPANSAARKTTAIGRWRVSIVPLHGLKVNHGKGLRTRANAPIWTVCLAHGFGCRIQIMNEPWCLPRLTCKETDRLVRYGCCRFITGAQEFCEGWRFSDNGYCRFDTILTAGRWEYCQFSACRIGLPRCRENSTVSNLRDRKS